MRTQSTNSRTWLAAVLFAVAAVIDFAAGTSIIVAIIFAAVAVVFAATALRAPDLVCEGSRLVM